MGSLGWPELILLALLVIVLFGARKLPEIGRGLGEGIRSFRTAMRPDEPDRARGADQPLVPDRRPDKGEAGSHAVAAARSRRPSLSSSARP